MLSVKLKLTIILLCVHLMCCVQFEKIYSHTFIKNKGNSLGHVGYSVFGYDRFSALPNFNFDLKINFLYQKLYKSNDEVRKLELYYNIMRNGNSNISSPSFNIPISNPMFTLNSHRCTFIQGHKSQLTQLSNINQIQFTARLSEQKPSQTLSCLTKRSQNNKNSYAPLYTLPYAHSRLLFTVRLLSSSYPNKVAFMFSQSISTYKKTIFLPCWNPFFKESEKNSLQGFWMLNSDERISYTSDFTKNFNLFVSKDNVSKTDGFYQCFIFDRRYRWMAVFSYRLRFDKYDSVLTYRKKRDINKMAIKVNESTHSLFMQWIKPSFVVTNYMISWGVDTYYEKFKNVSGDATSCNITNLKTNTKYYILFRYKAIPSKLSDEKVIIGNTKPYIPAEELPLPMKLRTKVATTWAIVKWKTRERLGHEGVLNLERDVYYKVFFALNRIIFDSQYEKNPSLIVYQTIANISGLTPGKYYECCVKLCLTNNKKICGECSFVTGFTTNEAKPYDAPRHLTLSQPFGDDVKKSVNKHFPASVHVAWQPPNKPNGRLQSYIILMTSQNESDPSKWISKTVSSKNLNTVMKQLKLNKCYYFVICCVNNHGRSPFSNVMVYKTPKLLSGQGQQITLTRSYSLSNVTLLYNKLSSKNKAFESNSKLNDNNGKSRILSVKTIIIGSIITIIVVATIIMIIVFSLRYCSKEALSRNKRNDSFVNSLSDDINPLHSPDNNYHPQHYQNNPQMGSLRKQHTQKNSRQPALTTPDLFRHTNNHSDSSGGVGGKMYQDMAPDRTDSPNSFNSGKDMPGYNMKTGTINSMAGLPQMQHPHCMNPPMMRPTQNQFGYEMSSQNMTILPRNQVSNSNVVMTTSQIATTSCNNMDPNFYPVAFLPHMNANHVTPAPVSPPRVNAAASDFNSINFDSNCMLQNSNAILSPGRPVAIAGSQGTVLFEMSTPQSSGGKSSLSGSGSCNGGFSKVASSFVNNQPITEDYNNTAFNNSDSQPDVKNAFSNEELSQEMENLEGLMNDLNQITQKEFEC